LEEYAGLLADVGEFEAAEETIDKLQKLESISWLEGLKAYNLLYKGLLKEDKSSYKEAVEILDRVLQTTQSALPATSEEIWYHELRAECYLMLNETLHAREDFEWNWEQYKQWPNTENMSSFGWAAYSLAWISEDRDSRFYDYLNQAIEIFSKLSQEPVGTGNAYRNLGLSYLTRGDLTRDDLTLGEESLNKGIVLATNKRELNEVQNVDFSNIEKIFANQSYEAQAHEILARLNEQINTRRIQLEQGRSVETELKEALERYPFEGDKINWAWIGIHAGLARLYTEGKRWNEAKTAYLLMQKEDERFLEAHLG
jgi:tetratricopeptide (TPR) repeat protein